MVFLFSLYLVGSPNNLAQKLSGKRTTLKERREDPFRSSCPLKQVFWGVLFESNFITIVSS
jgi:hypothetical protein